MPTDIYFVTENVRVQVDEEPGQVALAFSAANGLPCRLTAPGGHSEVYVNPSVVAFWLVSGPRQGSAVSPEESPQPISGRETVTYDIWGRTVRRRPRR